MRSDRSLGGATHPKSKWRTPCDQRLNKLTHPTPTMTHPKTHLLRRNTIVGSLVHRVCRVAAVSSAQRHQEHGDAHTHTCISNSYIEKTLQTVRSCGSTRLLLGRGLIRNSWPFASFRYCCGLLQTNLISRSISIWMNIYGILLSVVWPLSWAGCLFRIWFTQNLGWRGVCRATDSLVHQPLAAHYQPLPTIANHWSTIGSHGLAMVFICFP